jgi:hypothetical protein|tara:strand:+ start:234 stop:374 length:141 start_codon:yes stop_codon:yes gene_type:complete
MNLSELVVAINSLKYDLQQWKMEKENEEYYDDVLSEVQTILIDLNR